MRWNFMHASFCMFVVVVRRLLRNWSDLVESETRTYRYHKVPLIYHHLFTSFRYCFEKVRKAHIEVLRSLRNMCSLFEAWIAQRRPYIYTDHGGLYMAWLVINPTMKIDQTYIKIAKNKVWKFASIPKLRRLQLFVCYTVLSAVTASL